MRKDKLIERKETVELITRNRKWVGRKALVINASRKMIGRVVIIAGFRGDQSKGIPYVTVRLNDRVGSIETISAKYLLPI